MCSRRPEQIASCPKTHSSGTPRSRRSVNIPDSKIQCLPRSISHQLRLVLQKLGYVFRYTTHYNENLRSKMSIPSPISSSQHNPRLTLLNALRAKSKPITTFLGLPSLRAAQIVAQTGLQVSVFILSGCASLSYRASSLIVSMAISATILCIVRWPPSRLLAYLPLFVSE